MYRINYNPLNGMDAGVVGWPRGAYERGFNSMEWLIMASCFGTIISAVIQVAIYFKNK